MKFIDLCNRLFAQVSVEILLHIINFLGFGGLTDSIDQKME